MPPPINDQSLMNSESIVIDDEENANQRKALEKILNKLEHTIFLPTNTSLDIFRDFDVDYDGLGLFFFIFY